MKLPTLRRGGLKLRSYREADRPGFLRLFTDTQVMARVDGPLSESAASALFDGILGLSALPPRVHSGWLAEDSSGAHIGHGALLHEGEDLEIGYLLFAEYWGQGHATSIAGLLLKHGRKKLGRERLIATVDTDHAASRRVLEKVGMRVLRVVPDADGDYLVYSS
jgi:RimJ/RimL family protein N-acetyltransferase